MTEQTETSTYTEKETRGARGRLQTLVAALNQNVVTMASSMRLESDAIIVNECNEDAYSRYMYAGRLIQCYHLKARGVGLSRNTALMHADAELVLFSDEDIVYEEGYAQAVIDAFDTYRLADMLLFNVKQSPGRETYHNTGFGRVRWYNYGRYPAYAIAARTKALKDAGVSFSLLFGGGAKYMNGEDSVFLHDCLQKGLRIFHVPVMIGAETPRASTWFEGYTDKFFFDRGVLYRRLYGKMARPFGLRFLYKNRKELCAEKPFRACYQLLKEGIRHAGISDADGADDRVVGADEK